MWRTAKSSCCTSVSRRRPAATGGTTRFSWAWPASEAWNAGRRTPKRSSAPSQWCNCDAALARGSAPSSPLRTHLQRASRKMTVFIDPDAPAPLLRQGIYQGDVIILTKLNAVSDLVNYTREQLLDLFRPFAPDHAHEHIDKVQMAQLLGSWKPRFIPASKSQELVR